MCTLFIPHKVFADLVDVKIEKHQLNDLVMKGDKPAARGAFGAVFNRTLRTKVRVHLHTSQYQARFFQLGSGVEGREKLPP
jgi:hypothetical protein